MATTAGTDSRANQAAATRASLVAAAREFFGSRGFAETSLDDVVARARVTKGALYHHFSGKEDLFAAVYEQVLREVSDRVVSEFLRPDPWEALLAGCELWIDSHLDPAVQRIAMRDARAVLGWDTVRDVESRYGVVALRGVFRRAVRKEIIAAQPLRPLSLMVMGALNEACLYVADADDPVAARREVDALIERLLAGITKNHEAPGDPS
ncbi:MAG TPA: TetR/AcrR family transcriptional regulator [Acidimicrobiales bacterium]|nr:TetR/AcrR family transcriptional regulator [Acidimicrobiales bacterium]